MPNHKNADYNLTDDGRMYLLVKKTGGKYWRMNYRFAGKQVTGLTPRSWTNSILATRTVQRPPD